MCEIHNTAERARAAVGLVAEMGEATTALSALQGPAGIDEALRRIAERVACDGAELRVVVPADGSWRLAGAWNASSRGPIGIDWWTDMAYWHDASMARIDDRDDDATSLEVRSEMCSAQVKAVAALRSADAGAVLHLSWREPLTNGHPFSAEEMRDTCRATLAHLVLTDRWLAAEARCNEVRTFDPLTEVLNRPAFEHRLAGELDALGEGRSPSLALVLIDVTDLRSINDERGHRVGDHVLIDVARRLQSLAKGNDVVARLGEDEFVLLARLADIGSADGLAARIAAMSQDPVMFSASVMVELELSVAGVFVADPVPVGDVLRAADRALRSVQRNASGFAALTRL